jgi:type IV pilus assembly protein PilM
MIGLDIGTSHIKLCQIEKRENQCHIKAALMARNKVAPEGTKPEVELAAQIKTLLREIGTPAEPVASAIGSSGIVSRNFDFPKLPYQELKGALALETGQSASLDVNSMYSDFVILNPEGTDKLDVLFVGVPKDEIDKRIQVLQGAGIEPLIIDINNLALANCFWVFDPNPAKEAVVLLDIGHTYTNISVVDNDELRFARNITCGGQNITQEIARSLGVTPDQAESIKKHPELWGELGLNIKSVLRKSVPDLLEVVYRAMEYCMSRKKLASLDKILLTGGTSSLNGLESFFAETLGFHTEKWNPLMAADVDPGTHKEFGHFLSVALGLAVRNEKTTRA